MEKSFQLIRTNPRLTTNIKLVVDSKYNLYFESFDSCKELSDDKYKHKLLNKEALLEDELPKYYDSLPKNLAFSPKTDFDVNIMYDSFNNQFDDTYFAGAKNAEDQWYNEEFEYFAPLYIKKGNIPEKFIILRVDDPGIYDIYDTDYRLIGLNKDNFRSEIIDKWKCVKVIDLSENSNFGNFLKRNINDNNRFPEFSFFFDTKKFNFSKWSGLNYKNGIYTTSETILDDKLYYENPHFVLEDFITKGFENNGLIYPYILNIKYLFDDKPGDPDKYNEYSINRYFGFYIDKFEHIKSLTTYDLDDLDDNVNIRIENNIFVDNNDNAVNPFTNKIKENGWIMYNNKLYEIKKLNNGYYKLISDFDISSNDMTIFNSNKIKIEYVNNRTNIKNLNDQLELTIDKFINNEGHVDELPADLYLIEIDGIYHVLKNDKYFDNTTNKYINNFYIGGDYAITSDNKYLKYWKGGVNNTITKKIVNDDIPLQYNIYRLKFSDIKDFDFDRINTRYSDFEYEKNVYVETEEDKLNAIEYRDFSVPKRVKTHDKGSNGQYKPLNISSEYSAGDETFELLDNSISYIWEKNQNICKWGYIGSISHSDYIYKLNNSKKHGGVYNRTTNCDTSVSSVKEKTHDYFYRIGNFFSKKDDNVVEQFNAGEWDTGTYWTYLNNTLICSNNTSENKSIYTTYLGTDNYYYVYLRITIDDAIPNNNWSVGIYDSSFDNGKSNQFTTGNDVIISFMGKCKNGYITLYSGYVNCTFKEIIVTEIEFNYYLNQSTNIQTSLLDNDKFDLSLYEANYFDYFKYFFNNKMYIEDNGNLYKKYYKKYSYFNGGDNELPASSLFRGIEYKINSIEDIVFNNDGSIRSIIPGGGNIFNEYKLSVILNDRYHYYDFDENSGVYSNPIFINSVSSPIDDLNATLDSPDKNGIHVIVNYNFKNIIIIINQNIPINKEWISFNNTKVFGESNGIYYSKTKDDYNTMPSVDGLSINTYDPNKLTAYYFIQSMNNLNEKGIFDQHIIYYEINGNNVSKFKLNQLNNKIPSFYVEVSLPDDILLKKNSYNIYPIKGPSYNIYDKYMIYLDDMPVTQSIIDQPLSRKIVINKKDETINIVRHGERIENDKLIKRFIGYYDPVFHDINVFKPLYYWSDENRYYGLDKNYCFDNDVSDFGTIREMVYSKVSDDGNFLKLNNISTDRSIYPMVDEIGLSQTSRNIFLSSWDSNFYLKTLNEHTLYSDFVKSPTYIISYQAILSVNSISVSDPLGLEFYTTGEEQVGGEASRRSGAAVTTYNMIYGFNKNNPSDKITFRFNVTNLSIVSKTYGVKLYYDKLNQQSSTLISDESLGTIGKDVTIQKNIEFNRPIEYDDNQIKTTTVCRFEFYSLEEPSEILYSNNDIRFDLYNDDINYEILEYELQTGITYIPNQSYDFSMKFRNNGRNNIKPTHNATVKLMIIDDSMLDYHIMSEQTVSVGTLEVDVSFDNITFPLVGGFTEKKIVFAVEYPVNIFDLNQEDTNNRVFVEETIEVEQYWKVVKEQEPIFGSNGRIGMVAIGIGDYIYYGMGRSSVGYKSDFYKYNVNTKIITELDNNIPRAFSSICTDGTHIYITGGINSTGYITSISRYNINLNTFDSYHFTLSAGLAYADSFVKGDFLCIRGGRTSSGLSDKKYTINAYGGINEQMDNSAISSQRTYDSSSVIYDDKYYKIGGYINIDNTTNTGTNIYKYNSISSSSSNDNITIYNFSLTDIEQLGGSGSSFLLNGNKIYMTLSNKFSSDIDNKMYVNRINSIVVQEYDNLSFTGINRTYCAFATSNNKGYIIGGGKIINNNQSMNPGTTDISNIEFADTYIWEFEHILDITLSTTNYTDLTMKSFRAGGIITDGDIYFITEYGIQYSLSNTFIPLQSINHNSSLSTNSYNSLISNLLPGTTYYYRSYVKVGEQLFLGETKSVTTLNGIYISPISVIFQHGGYSIVYQVIIEITSSSNWTINNTYGTYFNVYPSSGSSGISSITVQCVRDNEDWSNKPFTILTNPDHGVISVNVRNIYFSGGIAV
ncbi:hypothetical protein [Trichloromonas sp.]|uniref:hypothetical protein n=1 Tax=Trichloromonas sp. TaxID=3069249 RepID=UPI002A3DD6FA|nr:hypothetical protein [Trichloromonas sp.]